MSDRLIVDFGNSNNWQDFWGTRLEANFQNNKRGYTPIGEVFCPLPLDRRICAVSMSSLMAQPHWRFAGNCNQMIRVGLRTGGQPDLDLGGKQKLWLNRATLIIFPPLVSEYFLSFEIPNWFWQMEIQTWKYIGEESIEVENLLEIIRFDIKGVSNKLDNLSINQNLDVSFE